MRLQRADVYLQRLAQGGGSGIEAKMPDPWC